MRFHVSLIISLFLIIAICVPPSSAQLQSNAGKSWKSGSASSANFAQLIVTEAQSGQISGKISMRFAGLWQGAKVKEFSGTQQPVLNFIRIDCTCEDGMRFGGWFWPGNTGSRADDRTVIYCRPMASPSELVTDCHPDDTVFTAYEADLEPVE